MDEIRDNLQELMERMGSPTTEEEAREMCKLLAERGITTYYDLDSRSRLPMSDEQFFTIIPRAVSAAKRAKRKGD